MCTQKLSNSQLNLSHGTKTKNKVMNEEHERGRVFVRVVLRLRRRHTRVTDIASMAVLTSVGIACG